MVEKRNTIVHNATSHSVKFQIWRSTCSPTLGRKSTDAHSAPIQPCELIVSRYILQHMMEKRITTVHNAKSPSVKLKIWKDICSPTPGRRCTCAHNVTIQPIKLLIFDATFWRTLGKSLKSATSEIILQLFFTHELNNTQTLSCSSHFDRSLFHTPSKTGSHGLVDCTTSTKQTSTTPDIHHTM